MKEPINQTETSLKRKRLVLMRGLPSCGKSWTAKRIAAGGAGVVIEFDSFFETEVEGQPGAVKFDWNRSRLVGARRWNFKRIRTEIDNGTTLIVVDDDHRAGDSSKGMAAYAMLNNYVVEFAEPEAPWWQAIRALLSDKESNGAALAEWAQKLCVLSRSTHSVDLKTFVTRMDSWQVDLKPVDLLTWGETPMQGPSHEARVAA